MLSLKAKYQEDNINTKVIVLVNEGKGDQSLTFRYEPIALPTSYALKKSKYNRFFPIMS